MISIPEHRGNDSTTLADCCADFARVLERSALSPSAGEREGLSEGTVTGISGGVKIRCALCKSREAPAGAWGYELARGRPVTTMRTTLNEPEFIRVYRELTGAGEAQARSAFMFACCAEDAGTAGDSESVEDFIPDPQWQEDTPYEPVTKPRSLSHLHQLPGATRRRFA